MKKIRLFIWIVFPVLLTVVFPFNVSAKQIIRDSSKVEVRTIDYVRLQEYRAQKEFMYDLQKGKGISGWDKIRYWFWEQYNRLMQRPGFRIGFKVTLWVLSIGIMLYAILRIIGMDKVMLWMKKDQNGHIKFQEENDSIYGVDFDLAIRQAVQEKNYRTAIRLSYLKSLRILSDRNLIRWTPNKTNIDYSAELSVTPYAADFDRITRYYEYAWYGEFEVNGDEYQKIYPAFDHFNDLLRA